MHFHWVLVWFHHPLRCDNNPMGFLAIFRPLFSHNPIHTPKPFRFFVFRFFSTMSKLFRSNVCVVLKISNATKSFRTHPNGLYKKNKIKWHTNTNYNRVWMKLRRIVVTKQDWFFVWLFSFDCFKSCDKNSLHTSSCHRRTYSIADNATDCFLFLSFWF